MIDSYIEKIPPSPKVLKVTLMLLNSGELIKAAQIAKKDLALNTYLKDLVNKPIYGFRNEVSDVSQIFGILGVSKSQQAVYNYMISLLSPEKWKLFKLNKTSFYNLQADLSANWQKILKHHPPVYDRIHISILQFYALPPSCSIYRGQFQPHGLLERVRKNLPLHCK